MLDKPNKKGSSQVGTQLALEPQELQPRIIHDPNDGRPLIQNGGGEILDPFPPGSKAEAMFMGERLPVDDAKVVQVGTPDDGEERKVSAPSTYGGSRDNFSWDATGPNAANIVCRRQPATAVYENVNGSIVIRQEAEWNDDEDTVAIITPDNAGAITDAVMALARLISQDRAK